MIRESWDMFKHDVNKIMHDNRTPGITPLIRLSTLGLRAGPSYIRKYLYCHLITFVVLFMLYLFFNGGVVPRFMRTPAPSKRGGDISILEHYPHLQQDASRVTWACASNTRAALEEALKGDKHVLEGDIVLHGQGTSGQRLVPVMANLPEVSGDLKFEDWIAVTKDSGRALKLDFQSIEAVEISLQTLNRLPGPIQIPLWLSGEVLPGPNSKIAPLDSSRFLRLCTKDFPKSTLLLGWRSGMPGSSDSSNVYDWSMVKSMHDLVEKWEIKQPLVFSVQAVYIRRSLPQLKWLLEMTGGSLAVFSGDQSGVTGTDLMYVRHRLPTNRVYYDLSDDLQSQFESQREDPVHMSAAQVSSANDTFHAEDWIVTHSGKQDEVYLGTSTVLLRHGFLLSKQSYTANEEQSILITSRVDFLPPEVRAADSADTQEVDPEAEVGIEVFLRVTQGARPSAISGIKCAIQSSGKLSISAQSVPGSDAHAEATWLEMPPCVDFTIQDHGKDKVMLSVMQPLDCYGPPSKPVQSKRVVLNMEGISIEGGQIAIRGAGSTNFIAIPQFNVEVKR